MIADSLKLIIGFITYGKSTAKYLPYFLSGLKKQVFQNFKILAVDNSADQDNENVQYLRRGYPEIEIEWAGGNIGFARAYNKMINRAIDMKARYFLAINPDIILGPGALGRLIKAMDSDDQLGSACPKILQWDPASGLWSGAGFKKEEGLGKTNIIDTCGIRLKSGLRFVDLGQGQIDQGQFDRVDILGPSGAVAMYRISAIEKVEQDGQCFDELMFMYKEDCDLAYRLHLAGFKSRCVADAIAYHDRTAEAKGESNWQIALNRRNKSRQVKKWSFLNQQIIFIKYWHLQSWRDKLAIFWQELKMVVFILLFEQYLLGQFGKLWKIKSKIKIQNAKIKMTNKN